MDLNGAADLAPQDAPPQPQFADPEIAARAQQVQELSARNVESIKTLAREHGTGLDPQSVDRLRFETLLGMVFDTSTVEGQRGRVEFDMRFEQGLEAALEQILRQIGMAKLAAGTNLSPQEIEALDRQQKQFLAAARNIAESVDPASPRNSARRTAGKETPEGIP